jgi:hypothetical protein
MIDTAMPDCDLLVWRTGLMQRVQRLAEATLLKITVSMAIALNEIVRRAEVHFGRWRTD